MELYYILQKAEPSAADIVERFYYGYKSLTDRFVREKKEELTQFNSLVSLAVCRLLSALEPVFERNYAVLRDA